MAENPDHQEDQEALPGTTLVGFGQHSNRTYDDVRQRELGYCRWVVAQENPTTDEFRNFQQYLVIHGVGGGVGGDNTVMGFGRHSTWTYRQVAL